MCDAPRVFDGTMAHRKEDEKGPMMVFGAQNMIPIKSKVQLVINLLMSETKALWCA